MTGDKFEWRMDYTLKRSRRRTLGLRVHPGGEVIAYAPRLLPRYFIDQFVQKQQAWVERQRLKLTEHAERFPPRQFVSGETFHLWGEVVTLQVLENPAARRPTSRFEDLQLRVEIPAGDEESRSGWVQRAIREAYQRETESRLPEFIEKYAVLLGAKPVVVKVVEQKRRWGSCSRLGSVRLNWRLSMFAPDILEYVVVHELAHLKVHNHSGRFWTTVASVLPEYKLRRKELRLGAVRVRM